MTNDCVRLRGALTRLGLIAALLCPLWPALATAQGPSPIAEWQLSAGEALLPFVLDEIPTWRGNAAVGAMAAPEYEGSKHSHVIASGNVELRYRDLAFASTSEGLGVNIWRGKGYRVGAALGLDLGRDDKDDALLTGLGDIELAPQLKFFAEKVFYPVVLRVAARRVVADNAGWSADFSVYTPVIGTKHLVVMLGPSLTVSDADALRRSFGISTAQSARSGLAAYRPDGGLHSASFGTSATWLIDEAWFVNATGASQWLLGSAKNSPLVTRQNQLVLSVIGGYRW